MPHRAVGCRRLRVLLYITSAGIVLFTVTASLS